VALCDVFVFFAIFLLFSLCETWCFFVCLGVTLFRKQEAYITIFFSAQSAGNWKPKTASRPSNKKPQQAGVFKINYFYSFIC